MASIFTKIINGEIPAFKVAEDENHLAFLDINPLAIGHTLVIPKKEIDYIFDLDENEFLSLQLFAKKVAKAIDKVVDAKRIGVAVIGLEVPHAHIHLVPINGVEDINFSKPKLQLSKVEFTSISDKICLEFKKSN